MQYTYVYIYIQADLNDDIENVFKSQAVFIYAYDNSLRPSGV